MHGRAYEKDLVYSNHPCQFAHKPSCNESEKSKMSDQVNSRSLVVFKDDSGKPRRELRIGELAPLADNRVRVQVKYSSLNYKDALCSTGHPGVARNLPLVPGIDAAGSVVQSNCADVATGSEVMIFHADFGTKANGGFTQFVDVPADYVYPLPDGLSSREAMIIGTAGFTAAQSVDELIKHGVAPSSGPVVVSGATGGVGSLAVKLLASLGYEVVASTGKADRHDMLAKLGAASVIDRATLNDTSDTPLLKGNWAGAVDTVGGRTLATILRMTKPHGCVTACGLVAGVELNLSIYPFILRGVTLQGIDSATISRDYREKLWARIAGEWQMDDLENIATEVTLANLDEQIAAILGGAVSGRVLVDVSSEYEA